MTIRVANDAGADALLVVFANEALPETVRLEVRADADVDAVLTRFGRWCGMLLAEPVPPGASVGIETNARIDRGRFIPWHAVTADSRDAISRSIALAEESSLEALAESDPLTRAARLWWSLDRNTHPELLASPYRRPISPWEPTAAEVALRIEASTYLARWLEARSCARRAFADERDVRLVRAGVRAAGDGVQHLGRPLAGERWVAATAHVLHRVIVASYAEGDDAFRFACGAFASGGLQLHREFRSFITPARRVALSQGGPDGSSIGLFAEFALAALDEEIRPSFWLPTLRAFVGMLPVFRAAFGAGAPLAAEAWGAACDDRPKAKLSDEAIAALMAMPEDREGLKAALRRELRALAL